MQSDADARAVTLHVCTNGPCRRDGARAALVELEELAGVVDRDLNVVTYSCFGRCGRGPNVSIVWEGGGQELVSGVRSTELSLALVERATGTRPRCGPELRSRLQQLRRVSALEHELAEAQAEVDVLDVSTRAQRATAEAQLRYDAALVRVARVLAEAPAKAHPRRLAEAVHRQVLAARELRPVSPEVEDVEVDDPDTWPEE